MQECRKMRKMQKMSSMTPPRIEVDGLHLRRIWLIPDKRTIARQCAGKRFAGFEGPPNHRGMRKGAFVWEPAPELRNCQKFKMYYRVHFCL